MFSWAQFSLSCVFQCTHFSKHVCFPTLLRNDQETILWKRLKRPWRPSLERGLVCGHFSAQRELKYLIGSFIFKCLTGISNCESVTILQKQQLQHCRPWGPAQRHNILIYTIKTINSQNRRSSSMSRAYPLTQTSLFHRFCSRILFFFLVELTVKPTVSVHCLHYLGKVTPVKVYEYIPTLLCCVQQFIRLNWTVYALHE